MYIDEGQLGYCQAYYTTGLTSYMLQADTPAV